MLDDMNDVTLDGCGCEPQPARTDVDVPQPEWEETELTVLLNPGVARSPE